MGEQLKRGDSASDRVVLNVGGTKFHTRATTLANSSTYFESLFSDRWEGVDADPDGEKEEVFLDLDPGPFATLLSYMRHGTIEAHRITSDLIPGAQFLGMDRLLRDVRVLATREAFEGVDGNILRAAEASGLWKRDDLRREYAKMTIFSLKLFSFEDQPPSLARVTRQFDYGNLGRDLVVSVSVPRESAGSNALPHPPEEEGGEDPRLCGLVPDVGNIVDGLNWLHGHGFTHFEEHGIMSTVDAVTFMNYDNAFLLFSRIVGMEDDSGSIKYMGDANVRKQFALSVRHAEYNGYFLVDTGKVTHKRVVQLPPVEQRSIDMPLHAGGCEIRAAPIVEVGHHLAELNWLERRGFGTSRREEKLENALREAYSHIFGTSIFGKRLEAKPGFKLSLWSRPINAE